MATIGLSDELRLDFRPWHGRVSRPDWRDIDNHMHSRSTAVVPGDSHKVASEPALASLVGGTCRPCRRRSDDGHHRRCQLASSLTEPRREGRTERRSTSSGAAIGQLRTSPSVACTHPCSRVLVRMNDQYHSSTGNTLFVHRASRLAGFVAAANSPRSRRLSTFGATPI